MSDWLASQLAEVVCEHVAGALLGYCMRFLRPAVRRALADCYRKLRSARL